MATRKKRKAVAAPAKGAKEGRSRREWARLFGEGTLVVLVFVIPWIIHPGSRNPSDVKDFALGVGVTAGLALVFVAGLARGRLSWVAGRLNLLVAAYLGLALATLAYSRFRFATISEAGKLAAHIGLYWLVILSVREMRQVRRIVGAALVAAVPVCIYAFMQAAGRDPLKWSESATRVLSTMGNATYLAGFLVLLIPLAVAAGWPQRAGGGGSAPALSSAGAWWWFAFSAVVAGMMLVSLLLTVSLSPIIGMMLGAALTFVLVTIRGGRRVVRTAIPAAAAALVMLLAVGFLFYQRLPRSQQERVQQVLHFQDPYGTERSLIQRAGLDIFRTQPIIGRGYGTYGIYALEKLAPSWYSDLGKSASKMLVTNYAHNEFIEVLAETGLVGEVIFAALVLAAFVGAFQVSLRAREAEWGRLGIGLAVGLTAFMFQNLFGVTFRQTGAVTYFWLSLGLLTVALPQARGRRQQDREGAQSGLEAGLRELALPRVGAPGVAVAGLGAALVVGMVAWLAGRPVAANTLLRQAEQQARAGNLQAAASLADRAVELNPYSFVGYYISGYAWGTLGDDERSLRANKRAISLLPGNATVYYNLGANYERTGELEEARQRYLRAVELMPTAAQNQSALARVLIRLGRPRDALQYAEEAVRLEPDDARWRLLLADAEGGSGNAAAAAVQLEEAEKLAPGNLAAVRELARLYLRMKQADKAAAAAEQWVRLDPSAPEAYVVLGGSEFTRGSYAAARGAFERAVALEPGNLHARLGIALADIRLGRSSQARQELEWLARQHPDTDQGRRASELLSKARPLPPSPGRSAGPNPGATSR
ncbi:MAG: tetratricopeptide repeat protein [Armatimonadota bacterium]